MTGKTVALLVGCIFFITVQSDSALLTVSQDGKGTFKTIQSAINAASNGDEISILDNAVYKEQVTVESFKSLTIKSENPLSLKKPVITYCDKENVGPKNCAEALDAAKITFDHNGALRIINSNDIVIDGITIDGGGAYAFGYQTVFSDGEQCRYPLQHGNSALVIFHSGNVTVRNSECKNAYLGIYVKDRNEGGIFANSNPSDQKTDVVPLSGFGKTGNNIFEFNRICNNSFGVFFESGWDLGNVIRYNLIYENHHQSEEFATKVKNLTSEGANQPGGAILFKDNQKSPVAVYNNTFWHNSYIFVGHWRCGSQHLIFNNIYAEPNQYWSQNVFVNSFLEFDHVFVNRMFNCVYACMTSKPLPVNVEVTDSKTDQVIVKASGGFQARIMNGINEVQRCTIDVPVTLSDGSIVVKTVTGVQCQGNLFSNQTSNAFPQKNEIRWLETKFKSTDPSSPDFLVPDWGDSLVNKYILDKGWLQSGVKDIDGSAADLGAISKSGNRSKNTMSVIPLTPITISGNTATVNFNLVSLPAGIVSPEISYMSLIELPDDPNSFATGSKVLGADKISLLTAPVVTVGNNSLTATIPSIPAMKYGFIELVITGLDQSGNPTSTIGFVPYRAEELNEAAHDPLAVSDVKKKNINQMKTYEIYDLNGRKITKFENAVKLSAALNRYQTIVARGMYIIKSTDLLTGKVEYLRNIRINDLLRK